MTTMAQQSSGQRDDDVEGCGDVLVCAQGNARQAANDLAGHRAVVTGATGGIGRAIVRRLLRAGVNVTVVDRDAERLAEVFGRACGRIAGTLEHPGGGRELARRVLEHAGTVELIVHLHELPTSLGILELDEPGFNAAFNPREPFFFVRELLLGQLAGRVVEEPALEVGARVVFVSPAYDDPFHHDLFHVRARKGCQALTRIVAVPAPRLRANMIDPGWIRDDGRSFAPPEAGGLWWGAPGRPDDVARLTMCLLSDVCTPGVNGRTLGRKHWQPQRDLIGSGQPG